MVYGFIIVVLFDEYDGWFVRVELVVGIVIGRAHDVERVAVVVFRDFQYDEIEPDVADREFFAVGNALFLRMFQRVLQPLLLRVEYLRVERGENVPQVGVINHGVVAFNESPEVFVRIDGVAHCGPLLRRVLALHACGHFLDVVAVLVSGPRAIHFPLLAGGGFECVN